MSITAALLLTFTTPYWLMATTVGGLHVTIFLISLVTILMEMIASHDKIFKRKEYSHLSVSLAVVISALLMYSAFLLFSLYSMVLAIFLICYYFSASLTNYVFGRMPDKEDRA